MAGRTRWALALIGCVALIYGATTAARAQGGGGFCDSRIGLQTYNPDLGWVTVHTNLHCINQCPPDQNGNPSTCTFINMSYGVLNYTICGCVPQGGQNQGQGGGMVIVAMPCRPLATTAGQGCPTFACNGTCHAEWDYEEPPEGGHTPFPGQTRTQD
ncbi:MAG: hypothetical protein ACYTFD_09905 [Planctomycetota bacterium]|jgi:hypothetical protein